MRLGAKSHYALLAIMDMVTMTQQGTEEPSALPPIRLSEIAERQGLPLPYLEQIFGLLKSCGVVTSVRGQAGGYHLARPPETLFVSDVLSAVGETLRMTRCSQKGACPTAAKNTLNATKQEEKAKPHRCQVHHLWQALEEKILNHLSTVSLAEVCQLQPSSSHGTPHADQ